MGMSNENNLGRDLLQLQTSEDRITKAMLALPFVVLVLAAVLDTTSVLGLFTTYIGRVFLSFPFFLTLVGSLVADQLVVPDAAKFPGLPESWVARNRSTIIWLTSVAGSVMVANVLLAYLALR